MWETLHNNPDWDCFRTLILPEILKTHNRPRGGILCTFGSHTFVPINWMCKRQTSASHSSTESEIISLDAGLRMDGIPALDLWDLNIEVLHSASNQLKKCKEKCRETSCMTHHEENTPTSKRGLQFSTMILNYTMSIIFPHT